MKAVWFRVVSVSIGMINDPEANAIEFDSGASGAFRFVSGVPVGVAVGVAVGGAVGVARVVTVGVSVAVGVGVEAGRISIAMVPHGALPLIEPVTKEADRPKYVAER